MSTEEIFPLDDEVQIAMCVKEFQSTGFPLIISCIRSLAWQYAHIYGIPRFSQETEKAGRTWARYFLIRFLQLRCRKATKLSVTRAMAANEPNVQKWFVEYKQVLNDLGINSPERIWSGDETGVQNIPKEEKVVVVKRKPAYQTVGADQGETSTILTFISGVGNVVPPKFRNHRLDTCQLVCMLLKCQRVI